LKKRNIPCELLLTSQNNVTFPKDILFKDEAILLVKVKGKHIFNFSAFSNIYDLNSSYLGNEAYIIDLEKKTPSTIVTLPDSKWSDNKNAYSIEAKLDNTLENLTVTRNSGFSGLSKGPNNALALVYTEALENDYKTFGAPNPMEGLKKKEKEGAEKAMQARQEENKKKKPEIMKTGLQEDFTNIAKYNEFVLLSDGRSAEKDVLTYRENFVLGDMVKKAGKNLLIGLPSLVGGQIQIQPDEKTRQYDIDIRYARHSHWIISFIIPEGYTAEGLEEMKVNLDNETGSFVSAIKVENNKIIFDIKKVYKERQVKKENWDKMVEFLDAAYNFSQKKIVLRKNNL
ncbi:MAG TPA: hypothetical protein VFD56_02900, partial [Chitinophagaceae bacterium]|nr:hypothetical protein [Chitinophagaceae bacterium]